MVGKTVLMTQRLSVFRKEVK